jgi:hypothetical protein
MNVLAYLDDVQIGHLVDSLWRHVIDGSNLLISLDIDRIICVSFGDTEVDNLQSTFYQDEIGWLEIGMDHILLMYSVHRL